MIRILNIKEKLTLNHFELDNRNIIMVNPDRLGEATFIIKQWIAIILAKHYDKDPKKMLEARKHFFRFVTNSLLMPEEIILITNNKSYAKEKSSKEAGGESIAKVS